MSDRPEAAGLTDDEVPDGIGHSVDLRYAHVGIVFARVGNGDRQEGATEREALRKAIQNWKAKNGTWNDALNMAAAEVRKELVRLDYVEGDELPDCEDKAIACAAVRAFLRAIANPLAEQIPEPERYTP